MILNHSSFLLSVNLGLNWWTMLPSPHLSKRSLRPSKPLSTHPNPLSTHTNVCLHKQNVWFRDLHVESHLARWGRVPTSLNSSSFERRLLIHWCLPLVNDSAWMMTSVSSIVKYKVWKCKDTEMVGISIQLSHTSYRLWIMIMTSILYTVKVATQFDSLREHTDMDFVVSTSGTWPDWSPI